MIVLAVIQTSLAVRGNVCTRHLMNASLLLPVGSKRQRSWLRTHCVLVKWRAHLSIGCLRNIDSRLLRGVARAHAKNLVFPGLLLLL